MSNKTTVLHFNFDRVTAHGTAHYSAEVVKVEAPHTETGMIWEVNINTPTGNTSKTFGSYAVGESVFAGAVKGIMMKCGIHMPDYHPGY